MIESCTNPEQIRRVKISGEREQILQNEVAELDVTIFDTLIFIHKYSAESFFSVYSKKDKRFLRDWLKNGNGPDEFSAPKLFKQLSSNNLFVYDVFRGGVFQVNDFFFSVLEIDYLYEVDPVIGLTQDMMLKNDSLLIGNLGYLSPEPFLIKGFDIKNKKEIFSVPILDLNEYVSESVTDFYTTFYNFFRLKPDGSKSVIAFNYFDRLLIFDEDYTNAKKVDGELGVKKVKMLEGKPLDLVNYYFDLEVTNDYIFALYYDQPESEYGEVMKPSQIKIFDWDGVLIQVIETPDYLMGISFDEEDQTLYGVDHFQEKILKYNFTKILEMN
ncbi:BF3164 family lipoprotein [Algoriphagus sp.]|uniref:BF3164 family lipoprotein n=1 Tax=Algoriphagus sp. TaxID=1872435 RepID=UPI002717C375|nr:BF3164 family lipoprotein [Algoriphagus sp.]MDO8967375.1 BF3164 family lipoprotein [Algoriphagus sp.]MDP3200657.1 BF3164 family lipoprotein [Algoriphagus sp.]